MTIDCKLNAELESKAAKYDALLAEYKKEKARLDLLETLGLSTTDFHNELIPVIHHWPHKPSPATETKWTLQRVSCNFESLRDALDAALKMMKP
jgi:hypothetical protein